VADNYPYHVNAANVKKLLEHIQSAGIPPRVTFQYITSVGFKSKNDRAILTVLKFIIFVDNSGVPTKLWQAYRVKSQSGKVLAGALKTAYKTLFDTYPDANRKDNEALRNFFSSHTSVAENTVTLMVRTFKTMADMGNFDSPGGVPEVGVDVEEPVLEVGEKGEGGAGVVKRKVVTPTPNGMTVNINIQLQIPAADKADVYDSFFAAMKKYLLS
jgi:hypothetical protein